MWSSSITMYEKTATTKKQRIWICSSRLSAACLDSESIKFEYYICTKHVDLGMGEGE